MTLELHSTVRVTDSKTSMTLPTGQKVDVYLTGKLVEIKDDQGRVQITPTDMIWYALERLELVPQTGTRWEQIKE